MAITVERDPLALALEPPTGESPAELWAREQREAQARSISHQIDDQIKAERDALRKRKKPIKVLLLGQSESGKSTTVKNFQLAYAYSSFLEERSAWRAVIHLNLIRSVNAILDLVTKATAPPPARARTPSAPAAPPPGLRRAASLQGRTISPPVPPATDLELDTDTDADLDADEPRDAEPAPPLTDAHRLLLLRLAPLRRVQRDLEQRLGAGSTEPVEQYSGGAAPWVRAGAGRRPREFFVTSRSGWRSALNRVKTSAVGRLSMGSRDEARVETASMVEEKRAWQQTVGSKRARPTSPFADMLDEGEREDGDEDVPVVESAAEVIASCAEDMAALWADASIRALLKHEDVRLEEGPGFFLNDVARVAARGYEPSDDDVVRARLRTMGVQEYRFVFERGGEAGREWLIYDVGGARSSRHAWFPYFDDINAIIFLAPISCFDETLAEDTNVNRLQDSMLLWKAVCSSKLLRKVQLILFLNKCDLLRAKLARGVRLVDYVSSYGDRPNDTRNAAKYFRQQFKELLTRHSPEKREFYSFLTTVVDTKATAVTVAAVREGIQRNHLKEAEFL
ncbi:G-alpha-domain-containing protein [Obba rivulosa]|uniref:G-alpha-domain-containing protein n=1 Tax=Obba rivulosa TaxID=1052685 RepID=A0A8E2AW68_9APHY|nr:G-alpha-domain-containing protein [Obba rivulosa]